MRSGRNLCSAATGVIGVILWLGVARFPALAADAGRPAPVKIAVFDFELEDVSAAGAASTGVSTEDFARMQAVSAEARRALAQSGRYALVDTNGRDAAPDKDRSLRNCNGCDAGIALQLAADQFLIGVFHGCGRRLGERCPFAAQAWSAGGRR